MESRMEQLFAIPGFSKLWLMPPGSPSVLIRKLYFWGGGDAWEWEVMVLPTGFVRGVPQSVMIWVSLRLPYYYGHGRSAAASGVNVSIEILDDTWERTVFHEEVFGNGRASLVLKRTELELTSCVDHNDNIPARCTLSFVGTTKKKKKQNTTRPNTWWRRLTRNLLAPLKMSHLSEEAPTMTMMTAADVPPTIHHLITIPGYSKLERMPTASSLTLRTFRFLGHGWSITLHPSGHDETSADIISITVVRRWAPQSADNSGIDIAIQILDKSHEHALFCKKQQMLGLYGTSLKVNKAELEAASCLDEEDSFAIKCTLTSFLGTKQQQL